MLQVTKGCALGIVGAYWNACSKKRVVVFAVTFSLPCLWFGTKGEKGAQGEGWQGVVGLPQAVEWA